MPDFLQNEFTSKVSCFADYVKYQLFIASRPCLSQAKLVQWPLWVWSFWRLVCHSVPSGPCRVPRPIYLRGHQVSPIASLSGNYRIILKSNGSHCRGHVGLMKIAAKDPWCCILRTVYFPSHLCPQKAGDQRQAIVISTSVTSTSCSFVHPLWSLFSFKLDHRGGGHNYAHKTNLLCI